MKKIKVEISPELQYQCSFMCAKEPDREWSGVLFYSTKGTFGGDDFEICTEFFYLMDIGTSTFTGYDYDPDLIQYMMSNPRTLELKKGHIHSHNKMGVFFSSTDTDEILDNSEFHNYYFSLIVNNKNEMTAKVAFRAENKTESTTHWSYRGDNGQLISGSYPSVVTETVVYINDCEILNNHHAVLSSKYETIIKAQVEEAKKKKPIVSGFAGASSTGPFSKGAQGKFEWEDDDDWASTPKIVTGGKVSKSKSEVESLVTKVITGDLLCEESLESVLQRFSSMSKKELKSLEKRMDSRLFNFYIDMYPTDQNLLFFNTVMTECCQEIAGFEDKYENIADTVHRVFDTEIK